MKIKSEIKKVLAIQASGIRRASTAVGAPFVRAVRLIRHCRGKVVVTGIGKSGLIAQKMASTLTSTGTPAIYLHPSEGVHGSLGVIHRNDLVFAIGKSGESEELLNILPSIRKIGAKIISLTSNEKSTLARYSTVVLHVPIAREACPLNLAPTTSSTVAMALGDAIAVSLMKLRGFSSEKFALYHPGGSLGKQLLLKVSDVMRGGKRNPVVRESATMDRLLLEISKKWTGAASIVDPKGKFKGLVTDFDIRSAFAKGRRISDFKIKDIMNPRPTTVYADEQAIEALKIMENRKKPLTVLPVIDRKRRSVGMIHLHDLIEKGLVSGSTQ